MDVCSLGAIGEFWFPCRYQVEIIGLPIGVEPSASKNGFECPRITALRRRMDAFLSWTPVAHSCGMKTLAPTVLRMQSRRKKRADDGFSPEGILLSDFAAALGS